MGRNSNRADMNYIMAKDKIVKYKIEEPVEYHISHPGHAIAKELERNNFRERLMKKGQ